MPNSEARWMNSKRGIPKSSAALPLDTSVLRYNSKTIISRSVRSIGCPRFARKLLRSSPRSRIVEGITDAPALRSAQSQERRMSCRLPCSKRGGADPMFTGRGTEHHLLNCHVHPDLRVVQVL